MSVESESTGIVARPEPSACLSCGQINKATAAFCRKCGASLVGPPDQRQSKYRGAVAGAEVGSGQSTSESRESESEDLASINRSSATASRVNKKIVAIIALAIVVIGVAVYFARRPRYKPSEGDLNGIADATFGPNDTIAIRTAARGIHIFNIGTGRPIRQVPLYLYANFERPFSPDLNKFVLGYMRPIPVYDCSGGGAPTVRELATKATNVWDARFDPTARFLVTGDDQSLVEIRDVVSGAVIPDLPRPHRAYVVS